MGQRPSYPLQLEIANQEALEPPCAGVAIHFRVRNDSGDHLCILDAWCEVRIVGGPQIARGRLFHQLHGMGPYAMFPPGAPQGANGRIDIPLDGATLREIEEYRRGRDLTLELDSRVLVSPLSPQPAGKRMVMTAPYDTQFSMNPLGDAVKIRIPQSEWVELLRRLRWADIELVELPRDSLRSDQRLARALGRLEEAVDQLRRGQWEDVLVSCRKAWESAAMGVTGEEDRSKALPKLKAAFGQGEKADRVDAFVREFGQFLHLARHEASGPVSFTRADALLAVRVTVGLLAYL